MYKNIETDEFMYPILDFDNYAISRSGVVGKCHRTPGNCDKYQRYSIVKPYLNNGVPWVKLYKGEGEYERFPIARLNLQSIYGELPFKIKYYDGNSKNVIQDNLAYVIDKWEISEGIVVGDMKFPDKVLILSDSSGRCEVFKSIPDRYMYNNGRYWISSKGVIFDLFRKCLISRSNDGHGYYKVALQIPGRNIGGKYYSQFRATPKVHTLVYVSWVDSDLDGMTIDHLDGRRHNNDVMNLEKVTSQENIRRAHDRNLDNPGVIRAKWSTNQVNLVCQLLEQGKLYCEIAEALGIDASDKTSKEYKSVANLCIAIRDGRTYQDIASKYNIQNNTVTWKTDYKTPTKFDPETIRKICEGLVEGKGPTELHKLYPEVTQGTIQNIKIGKQYKDIAATVPGMDKVISTKSRHYLAYEESEYIAKMISEGKSYKEIAISLEIENPCKANPEYKRISSDIRKVIDGKVFPELKKKYKLERINNDTGQLMAS